MISNQMLLLCKSIKQIIHSVYLTKYNCILEKNPIHKSSSLLCTNFKIVILEIAMINAVSTQPLTPNTTHMLQHSHFLSSNTRIYCKWILEFSIVTEILHINANWNFFGAFLSIHTLKSHKNLRSCFLSSHTQIFYKWIFEFCMNCNMKFRTQTQIEISHTNANWNFADKLKLKFWNLADIDYA